MSGLKTGLGDIKESFSLILKGFILFILATSGLGFAVLLRYFGYNSSAIMFAGIILEVIGLILSYMLLRKHITIKEEDRGNEQKGKRRFK